MRLPRMRLRNERRRPPDDCDRTVDDERRTNARLDFERILQTGRAPSGYELLAWRDDDGQLDPARTHPAALAIIQTIHQAKRSGQGIPWKRVMLRAGVPRSDFPNDWSATRGPSHIGEFLAGFPGVQSYALLFARGSDSAGGVVEFSVVEAGHEKRVNRWLSATQEALSWCG